MARRSGVSLLAALLVGGIASVVPVGPATAAATEISMLGSEFIPAAISIQPGDTVRWTNTDNQRPHGVRSSVPAFNSGTLGYPASFSYTYSQPGTFNFVCVVHSQMVGTVEVQGQAMPPQGPPREVRAVPGTGVGRIQVTWTQPVSDGGSPILGYEVCRIGGQCRLTIGRTFHDTGVEPFETQRYTVSARNSFGIGPPSDEVCSKPFPWLAELGC